MKYSQILYVICSYSFNIIKSYENQINYMSVPSYNYKYTRIQNKTIHRELRNPFKLQRNNQNNCEYISYSNIEQSKSSIILTDNLSKTNFFTKYENIKK